MMLRGLLLTLCAATAVSAEEPAGPPKLRLCAVLDNRIVGPRSADRPLPLQQGDPAHGLRPACSVSWSKLSPTNHALAVTDCYQDSLLQVANADACPGVTGPLWIGARWVVTSAELQQARADPAQCQQLETSAYAATRDFPRTCRPEKKEIKALPEGPTPSTAPPAEASPTPARPPTSLPPTPK